MKTLPRFLALILSTLASIPHGVRAQSTASATAVVLYDFTGVGSNSSVNDDGAFPYAGLTRDINANLYGTTASGGPAGKGTVFRTTPDGQYVTLHRFTGSDGATPLGRLYQGPDANFYGTTYFGGANNAGTVFKITPAGVLTTLHSFAPGDGGANPYAAALAFTTDGNFYGTTRGGGASSSGAVFKITPAGVYTTLFTFHGPDGAQPLGGLADGEDGSFYGTTSAGGAHGLGTAFKITRVGVLTTLHHFNGVDGANPYAGLLLGDDDAFYGTTEAGGANKLGTVFKLGKDGALTTLHSFAASEGAYPFATLIQNHGNFFGTTTFGGDNNLGTVFKMTPDGTLTPLYSFSFATGTVPEGNLQSGPYGNLFGTTSAGGANGTGTIFRLSVPSPAGTLQFGKADYAVNKDGGHATISVRRVGGSEGAVTVAYATANGTAVAGTDYTAAEGTLSWADGDTTDKTLAVPIIADTSSTGDKTVRLSLSALTGGAVLGTVDQATLTILDAVAAATPTVTIASPVPGLSVVSGSSVPFAASVADPGGILSRVQFFVNDTEVYRTSGDGPFVYAAKAPPVPGTYVIKTVATDTQDRTSSASVTVRVVLPNPNASAPTAALLTPIDGRNFLAGTVLTLDVSAAAAASTGLDHVILYANGEVIATFDANGNPVSLSPAAAGHGQPTRRDATAINAFQTQYAMPLASGIINLVCAAVDLLGQSTVSTVASIQSVVTNDKAPLVAVTGLTNGAHIASGRPQTLVVVASDPDAKPSSSRAASVGGPVPRALVTDAILSKVEYFLNGLSVAGSASAPYGFTITPPAAGKYVLHAVATDASGLAAVSAPVVVEVDPPPTVDLKIGGTGVAHESGGNGVVLATRGGDLSAPLTVFYKTKGAARAGVDYKKTPGTVTIPAGATKAKIKIKPINGSPNAATLKVKVVLLPATDGTYTVGARVVKITLVGE